MDDTKKSKLCSNLFLLYIFLIALFESLVIGEYTDDPLYRWSNVIVGGLIVFSWFTFDNRLKGLTPTPLYKIGVVALAVIFVPIYLFKSRGSKAALLSILKYLGKFIVVFVLLVVLLVLLEVFGLYQPIA